MHACPTLPSDWASDAPGLIMVQASAPGSSDCAPDAPAAGCPCLPKPGPREGACQAGFQCAEGAPAMQLAPQLRHPVDRNGSSRCTCLAHACLPRTFQSPGTRPALHEPMCPGSAPEGILLCRSGVCVPCVFGQHCPEGSVLPLPGTAAAEQYVDKYKCRCCLLHVHQALGSSAGQ